MRQSSVRCAGCRAPRRNGGGAVALRRTATPRAPWQLLKLPPPARLRLGGKGARFECLSSAAASRLRDVVFRLSPSRSAVRGVCSARVRAEWSRPRGRTRPSRSPPSTGPTRPPPAAPSASEAAGRWKKSRPTTRVRLVFQGVNSSS